MTEAALPGKEDREAEARRRASNILQSLRNPLGDQASEQPRGDYGRRRGKEPAPSRAQEAEEVTPLGHMAQQYTPPARPYGGLGPSRFRPTTPGTTRGTPATSSKRQHRWDPMANTPWGLWTSAGREKKEMQVTQGTLSATMDEIRRHRVNEHTKSKQHDDFGRNAWMQSDKNNSAWVTAFPKEHNSLSAS